MERIEMLDLNAEDQPLRDQIYKAIADVIERGDFINGLYVKQFQQQLESQLHIPHIVPCGNGTDALQLCLMALNLPPGSEIITPAFSYAATAEVIYLLGHRPVYVDVDERTFNIDGELIEEAITPKTAAIMPVHLYGQCADMNALLPLAQKHNLYVVEDAAQAVGAGMQINGKGWQAAGSIGDLGGYSFFPSKNLGAYGDAGAVATRNETLAGYIRSLANHGQSERYTHLHVGINSRLDTLQAAILTVKLNLLKQKTARRQEIAARYNRGLGDLSTIQTPYKIDSADHIYHQYTLRVNGLNRDEMVEMLHKKNISARIYYPRPLPLQPAYKNDDNKKQYPVSESLSNSVFSIPVHPSLKDEQVDYIIDTIRKICSDK